LAWKGGYSQNPLRHPLCCKCVTINYLKKLCISCVEIASPHIIMQTIYLLNCLSQRIRIYINFAQSGSWSSFMNLKILYVGKNVDKTMLEFKAPTKCWYALQREHPPFRTLKFFTFPLPVFFFMTSFVNWTPTGNTQKWIIIAYSVPYITDNSRKKPHGIDLNME